ncbi:MAG: hypothetical protein HUU38_09410, partial [Anaerolineales bacterium]|nr:hypothetical protein [Anaerolineales bacterium]
PGKKSLKTRLIRFATDTYMRFPILREWVKSLRPARLNALRKTAQQTGLVPAQKASPASQVILNSFGLSVWVNDQTRFARGVVPPAEKDALLTRLATFLKADRDPINGLPIIANVYRGEALYHGPFADACSDLIIEYANHYRPQTAHPGKNPYTEGGHTPNGIFLAQGRGIAPRGEIFIPQENPDRASQPSDFLPSLIDLAPTILHLFDQPIPPDMDGRVLTEIFDPAWLAAHPLRLGTEPAQFATPSPGQDLSAEEEASVEDQLRRLGYI